MAVSRVAVDASAFGAEIAASASHDLRANIAAAIQQRAGAGRAVFCQETADGMFVPTCASDGEPIAASAMGFARSGAFARGVRVNDELLIFRHLPDLWDYFDAGDRAQLDQLGADACLPLVAGADLVAFVLLCHGGDPSPLKLRKGVLEACAGAPAIEWASRVREEHVRARADALRRSQQLGVAGQVAASVAHEVRNPLAAIRSLVQFARETPLPEDERRQILDDVLEEVDRIDHTVTGMLELSQPRTSVRRATDLAELVRSAGRFVRAYAARRGVTIDMRLSGDCVPAIVDEREVRQVITNLLLNACQASDRGGQVLIGARTTPAEAGARWALIEVHDRGRGIATDDLCRVFEPFFTTRPDGTGLGLPFCRDVVERHGGTIAIDSTVGVGTSVTARLPLWDGDEHDSRL